jgi:hypothetical protein
MASKHKPLNYRELQFEDAYAYGAGGTLGDPASVLTLS